MGKPKMAVLRAFPRMAEFNFYTALEKFEVKLIGNNPELTNFFQHAFPQVENIYLPLRPVFGFDPLRLIKGHWTHRSWADFEGLESQLEDCDLINISDTYYFYGRQGAQLAQRLKKPLVTIVWENIPRHPAIFIPPYAFNVREVVKNTTLFILRSQSALRFTDSLNISRRRVKVIYKGIDLSLFYPPEERLASPEASVKILYVGQVAKSKGIDDLLRAFVRLYQGFAKVELLLAGRMYLAKMVEDLARDYPVKYLGFVDYGDLPSIYRQADVFCSLSKGKERFSYTLMEAQASGLPIVATRCGGIPEEVGSQNFLVDQGDVEGAYLALKKLVEDRDLRSRLGRLNRERAKRLFDLKNQAKKTEEAILSIL